MFCGLFSAAAQNCHDVSLWKCGEILTHIGAGHVDLDQSACADPEVPAFVVNHLPKASSQAKPNNQADESYDQGDIVPATHPIHFLNCLSFSFLSFCLVNSWLRWDLAACQTDCPKVTVGRSLIVIPTLRKTVGYWIGAWLQAYIRSKCIIFTRNIQ